MHHPMHGTVAFPREMTWFSFLVPESLSFYWRNMKKLSYYLSKPLRQLFTLDRNIGGETIKTAFEQTADYMLVCCMLVVDVPTHSRSKDNEDIYLRVNRPSDRSSGLRSLLNVAFTVKLPQQKLYETTRWGYRLVPDGKWSDQLLRKALKACG